MKIPASQLKSDCCTDIFDFETTAEIKPFEEGIIGQDRAVSAVNLGLRVEQGGYNIFMSGLTGTGRTTYAKTITQQKAKKCEVPQDLCYIYNFEDDSQPQVLMLPAGMGINLREDMDNLIKELKEDIPKAFASEEHEKSKNVIMNKFQEKSNKLIEELENEIRESGFILQNRADSMMPTPIPLDEEGKPISKEEYQQLPPEQKKKLKDKNLEVQKKVDDLRRVIRDLRMSTQQKLDELDKKVGLSVLKPIVANLKDKYSKCEEVITYLNNVSKDIMDNIDKFKNKKEEKNILLAFQQNQDKSFFIRYKVNLIVNNKETKGAPVVVESNPTYYNLFGKIEGKSKFGAISTDFTMIKAGSVHKANGGYLVINARELLQKPFSWETLKRTLLNQEIVVENIGEQYRVIPITTIKPEPISIELKVILIGSPFIYQILYKYDEEFKKLFKVKADFDIEMERNEVNLKKFASFVSCICERENINHFTAKAVAEVVEYSSRLTGKKDKLSTKFNEILEILYEANAWADINQEQHVQGEDVKKAIKEKIGRSNLAEEKIQEMIKKNNILIDIQKQKIGQINGLAVYQTGQYSFGKPTKITARTFVGKKGVINIEREAEMSGNIHNKAVLILSGFLGGKYAQDKPLSLSASLAFEQNYGGIDGDSASCAELIVLLSALIKRPIRQDLAITGSMNQKGNVQPIGGVNEKIEGFYKVCKHSGLTGKQGVVIPVQNKGNIILDQEVITAVAEDQFHIYAVENIDQAIELMMGKPAEGIHEEVGQVLTKFANKANDFSDKD